MRNRAIAALLVVSAELHVFPDGGHGFGIAGAGGKEAETWPELFLRWGETQGFFR